MKKWLLHIIYIGVTGILAWSCTNNFDEEFTPEEAKQINVTFTLAMEAPRSRAVAEETGNDYENWIDTNGLQVLFYSKDGTCLGKVKDVSVFYTDHNYIYQFVGNLNLKDINTYTLPECKIMVFANCPTVDETIPVTELGDLSFEYTPDNYKNKSKNIPMWGVAPCREMELTPGSRTDLGTIYILRAMAKVEVRMSSASLDYALLKVSLSRYYKNGYCLPGNYSGLDDTKQFIDNKIDWKEVYHPYLTGQTIEEGVDFQKENNSYILYMPEDNNKDGEGPRIDIAVTKNGELVTLSDPFIYFKDYADGTPGEEFNIIRNHYYIFNVTIKEDQSGNIKTDILTEIKEWSCVDVSSDYE